MQVKLSVKKMKLSFVPMLALVWLAAIAMVCMEHRGQRGRGQRTYAMKRYVRQLQVCLRDMRQQNKILEDKNRILEVENEACKTENEACNTENEKLQQEIDDLEETAQCCK